MTKKRYMLIPIASVLLNFSILTAQNWTEMSGRVSPYVTRLDGERLTCGRATQEATVNIREALDRILPRTPPSGKYALSLPAANISVNYSGFAPETQAAFQRAVDIWSALLITTVPIEIDAVFGEEEALGSAAPHVVYSDSSSSVWWPIALWNQLRERDALPDRPDIEVTMSDSRDWYYGLDGQPGDEQFDFVSVVLHEIGHGLGISDSFREDEENGTYKFGYENSNGVILPTIFDWHILSPRFDRLISDFPNPSEDLFKEITSIKLFWDGTNTRRANGGSTPVMLWAPEEYSDSSIAHLDFHAYPPGTPNALMNPFTGRGEASHEPGPLMLAVRLQREWDISASRLRDSQSRC